MSGLPTTHSVDDVAAALGVKRRWLLDAAATRPDRYPSVKVAGRVRFTDAQVEAILTAHTRSAAATPRAVNAWGRPVRSRRRAA